MRCSSCTMAVVAGALVAATVAEWFQGPDPSAWALASAPGGSEVENPLAAHQPDPLFVAVDGATSELLGVSRGAAWGDVDGDGYPELVVTRPGGPEEGPSAVLFRNREGTLVRGEALPVREADWEGASWIDLDGDGDLDLMLVGRNGAGAAFVENRGARGFVQSPDLFGGLVTSASMICWADADLDGRLDAFVVGYGDASNRLFRGVAPWTLEPVALPEPAVVGGASRACVWADLDDDGLPELVLANARIPNVLLRNGGDFRFTNDTSTALSTDNGYSYGVSAVDYDGDGVLDVFVANFDGPNVLLRGVGGGRLERAPGAPESAASKGHTWGDFDLDGRLDLYLGSGTPAPAQLNELYLGGPDGGFDPVEVGVIAQHADTSAAVAAADMDDDGDLDIFVANWGSAGSVDRLYRNTASGSWLKVWLPGPSGGIGARVSLSWTEDGRARAAHRWVTTTTGYAGQDDASVHFGLGAATTIDELEVRWPSGCIVRRREVPVRRTVVVPEGECARGRTRRVEASTTRRD